MTGFTLPAAHLSQLPQSLSRVPGRSSLSDGDESEDEEGDEELEGEEEEEEAAEGESGEAPKPGSFEDADVRD